VILTVAKALVSIQAILMAERDLDMILLIQIAFKLVHLILMIPMAVAKDQEMILTMLAAKVLREHLQMNLMTTLLPQAVKTVKKTVSAKAADVALEAEEPVKILAVMTPMTTLDDLIMEAGKAALAKILPMLLMDVKELTL
jgi:hypothetical protein